MAEKFSFGEGACLNKPPLFCGMNYDLWCIRMKFFVESINRKIWNVITNNYLLPISENVSSEREHLDCIAMNIIVSTFDSNELLKVSDCESAKEMWDTFKATHESTTKLEKSKTRRRRRKNKKGLDLYFMAKKEDEKANICLVAEGDDESSNSSEVSSCASLNEENYSELLEAFQETHDEAN